MRRTINLIIAAVVLVVGLIGFYLYFPEIWGDVIYPLEYQDEIIKSSLEFKVERNLIAAVIYSESHFNPKAGSHAGAKGLMQLMPATAAGVAKNIGLTDYSFDKIYNPAINIRLGTAYLRSAIDSRKGNINVALANYNAGPGPAGLYQATNNPAVLPRETSSYIRKVNSAWEAYDRIYGTDWSGPIKPYLTTTEQSFVSQINIKNLVQALFGK